MKNVVTVLTRPPVSLLYQPVSLVYGLINLFLLISRIDSPITKILFFGIVLKSGFRGCTILMERCSYLSCSMTKCQIHDNQVDGYPSIFVGLLLMFTEDNINL